MQILYIPVCPVCMLLYLLMFMKIKMGIAFLTYIKYYKIQSFTIVKFVYRVRYLCNYYCHTRNALLYGGIYVILIASPPESIEWFIEAQVFLRLYDSAPWAPSPTSPVSKLSLVLSLTCVSPVELTDGRGGRGWASNQIIQLRESMAFYKSFNTRWLTPSILPLLITLASLIPSHQVTTLFYF